MMLDAWALARRLFRGCRCRLCWPHAEICQCSSCRLAKHLLLDCARCATQQPCGVRVEAEAAAADVPEFPVEDPFGLLGR